MVPEGTNEIPVVRTFLTGLDLDSKLTLSDAARRAVSKSDFIIVKPARKDSRT